MGYKNIDRENGRELRALDDEQLDMVAGGTGEEKEEVQYLCRACLMPWKTAGEYKICQFCGSDNIVSGAQAVLF